MSTPVKAKPFKRKIIVRKIRKVVHEQPRGAWKIAYADFVTALMAFFLMLWLLSSTTEDYRNAISEYFETPLMVVFSGGQSNDVTSSLIVGGYGEDKTRASGQVNKGEGAVEDIAISVTDAGRLLQIQEVVRLQSLKTQLEQLIRTDPKLNQFKDQLQIDLTSEGLRILIIDAKNRPMFEIGSAILQPYTLEILRSIGRTLNQVPNKIGLSGHTDAADYQGGSSGYSNWDLSADRANASRRALISGGMAQEKILRVVGLSDSVLFNPADPYDAHNRRISIIVMNQQAMDAVLVDGE
ncbi:MAG: flagellar motor protein MotB [Nitrosomonadales bacterium]